jgi:hypothetical protein
MTSLPDRPSPNDKKLRFASFAIHAARGFVRDQKTRRVAMFWTVLAALVMLFGGSTFLAPVLDPVTGRDGLFYWCACGWITVTASIHGF